MMSRFNLSAWAVRERALTLYFILLVALAGLYAFVSLGRAEDPIFTIKVMTVSAIWEGASAEQMQQQVADRLEKRLQEVPYFDRVETTARPGQVNMQIQFLDQTPAHEVANVFYQVRKRMLDEASYLPQGVKGPFVNDDFSDVYYSLYALTAPELQAFQLIEPAEAIRDRLLRVPGVQKVNLIGERPHQVFIELNTDRLSQMAITPQQVFSQIEAYNRLTPSGQIDTQSARVYLRMDSQLNDLTRIENLPLSINQQHFQLKDIAQVSRGYQDPPQYLVRDQGQEALMIGVIMQTGYNGLTLGKDLAALEHQLSQHLPLGFELEKITNQADAISQAIDEFQLKFLVALGVVMLVSFLALGLRAGLVVALAVPLTLAITFFIMMMTGKNLDRITLGALILALGLLVDDAIIAIEMMLVKIEEGLDKVKAASYAWSVTAMPMLIGTLITAVGFVPIGFAASNVGEYAGNIFWVLAISLIASWFVAVVFTPYLGVKFLKDPTRPGYETAHADPYQTRGYRVLRRIIQACVHQRKTVLFATFVLFVLSIIGMAKLVEKQFFPSSDRPELMIDIYLPEGTSIAVTDQLTQRMENLIAQQPEVRTLSSYIGAGAPRFFMALNPELPNPAFAKIIAITGDRNQRDALQTRLKSLIDQGEFSEARVRVHPLLYGPPVPWPVTFRVMGEDPLVLRQIANQVQEIMEQHPQTLQPHLEWGQRTPVIRLDFDPQTLEKHGFTPLDIQQQLQFMLQGQMISELRHQTRSVQLLARAPEATRLQLEQLADLPLTNRWGQSLPLDALVNLTIEYEEPVLKRRNRIPYISVNSEIQAGAQPPDVTMQLWPQLDQLNQTLPLGYRVEIGGSVEESGKAQNSIRVLMPVMVILMFTLVMLMMRSFSGMFMVILTAPLGLIGAVMALLLFSQPFGFVATLGLIGLAGILMRNTLILVGQIDDNKRNGLNDYDAVVDATVRRARPVVLTALAAVLAFIPLTTSTFWGPLAYVLIGGITMGTLLTLLFLPALYSVWFKVKKTA
ncbi:efflux RND transporter permease subunit [Thiomicrospira microaerophila]|uniref:efflux RND transporter permease subunit n=1 Tax=Thiomicrospira microaerophila TaxID=406020 RepID=UPI00200DEB78|nr:efflux RND transporter permease subunit [Thiomicrospira microaerophila]UQB41524.1 efflux RND transporter permease subunit [Thiomicrospira microaerophila]